jgi:hypothetical protein
MKRISAIFFSLFTGVLFSQSNHFNFSIDQKSGKVILTIDKLNEEFLMVSYLSNGLGSNDVGLDRGKIMSQRIVKFAKYGDKIMLVEPNYDYRAISDNAREKKSVEEAFAKSVIYGFKIDSTIGGSTYRIDISPMLMEDMNDVSKTLKNTKQGTYKIDKLRSAIDYANCHIFPLNAEFEIVTTYTGEATGNYVGSVTPTTEFITLGQHVSFIKLPDPGYQPRAFHPYAGYFFKQYFDYATPIQESLVKKVILRHRLEKKYPNQEKSEAVKPIVYYVDNGCPEPVKTALIEGARWWNEAFEAAGFINAFQVYELPADAHMLDIRYNVIQWVHRSTRGWSYGSNIHDPRTGEIIKGHVSLGSLRVRQDFMIAQGILSPYDGKENADDPMMTLALARLRQLSAHEVGHTIGLSHNFSSSINDLASVMDYPHPIININDAGEWDLSNSYDTKIGEWDKRAIMYGYKDFGKDETKSLESFIEETQKMGFLYQTDSDARPVHGASVHSHMWDNGKDPISELERIMKVRQKAIDNFGVNSIKKGVPYSELEKVFVPIYYMQRYQVEAVSKMVGGQLYNFAVKGDALPMGNKPLALTNQKQALTALLKTVSEQSLAIPEKITELLQPPADGYPRSIESFKTKTYFSFDVVAAKEAAIDHLLTYLLHPVRLNRLQQQPWGTKDYLKTIHDEFALKVTVQSNNAANIAHHIFMMKLTSLLQDDLLHFGVKAEINRLLKNYITSKILNTSPHHSLVKQTLEMYYTNPMLVPKRIEIPLPPGAPIGCESVFED